MRSHMYTHLPPPPPPPHTHTQLDAGAPENMALHSRDEQSVLVVSYSDLKSCMETTFSEVLSKSEHSVVGGAAVSGAS